MTIIEITSDKPVEEIQKQLRASWEVVSLQGFEKLEKTTRYVFECRDERIKIRVL